MRLSAAAVIIGILFFLAGVLTSSHYGVSWDEPEHFLRGQAYLRFFLTGQVNYKNLSPYNAMLARKDKDYHDRSYYQHDSTPAANWFISDAGHPPLNDILASFFNLVFYQKLGWVGDIEGYHLFNILMGGLLVSVVFIFASKTFGIWAGIFSAMILSTYPLFWAESHFNIKDPPQAAFFMLAIYFFWMAVDARRAKYILVSSIFAGLAFSIKFNILFFPFIMAPWVALLIIREQKVRSIIFTRRAIMSLVFFPFVMFGILILIWPYLWQDVVGNLISIFSFYKELGTEENFTFNPAASWNFYAASWVLYTTPPITLLTFIVGLFVGLEKWKEKNYVFILWCLLLVITILRVSFPNTTIYGGVRQIMEYIPAMALISGVGAAFLLQKWRGKLLERRMIWLFNIVFSLLFFVLLVSPLIKIHPNENVYFNFLIGGLSGAKEKNIPSWGNSYGNAYWQAIQWINKNAEKNARVALIQGTSLNIPVLALRPDIDFSNDYWSGIYRDGEYLVELTHQTKKLYPFAWDYVERMLNPVYEVKVDGVAIAKIWKNDLPNTKSLFAKNEVLYGKAIKFTQSKELTIIDLGEQNLITRLLISHTDGECNPIQIRVSTSVDGTGWEYEQDKIPVEQVGVREKLKKGKEVFFFAGRNARFIKLETKEFGYCFYDKNIEFKVYILEPLM